MGRQIEFGYKQGNQSMHLTDELFYKLSEALRNHPCHVSRSDQLLEDRIQTLVRVYSQKYRIDFCLWVEYDERWGEHKYVDGCFRWRVSGLADLLKSVANSVGIRVRRVDSGAS